MTENPFINAGYNPDVRPDAEERADTPRDQYGRYMMPRPGLEHTAAPAVPSTRVSTVKSAGIDRKGLEIYGKRKAAQGFVRDLKVEQLQEVNGAELLIAAMKAVEGQDKRELDRIVEEAYNRGGGKERSTLGTAVHEFTERRNRGEDVKIEDAPEQHRKDIRAYETALERAGVFVIREFLERIVNCPWSIQGTVDNIVWYQNPNVVPFDSEPGTPGELEMRVADLKTGRDLSLGWGEILIQLWLYANATHMWDASAKVWVPMPRELRKDRALIFHVPMDGTATVYDVNLAGIGDVVAAAMVLRRHHGEADNAVTKVLTVDMREAAYIAPDGGTSLQPVATGPSPVQDAVETAIRNPSPETITQALQAQVDSAATQLAGQEPDEAEPAVQSLPGLKARDGSPLQPLAKSIPGKRGCGKCGRIGHKRNSAACWGNDDPALRGQKPAEPDDQLDPMTPAEDEFSDQSPHCAGCNEGWRPGPDGPGGVWVCGKCGKPSAQVATKLETPIPEPSESPFVQAAEPRLSDPAATVGAPVNGPPWPTDWVLPALNNAQTATEVWNIRTEALERGAWNPEIHDRPGQIAYETLLKAGKR